jgi:hypothetical protein
LSNAHTHPQKIHIKINHIIKGFPLGQYLSDFEIRSGKIDLNGLINSFYDRVLLQGGGSTNAQAHPLKIHPKISHIIIGFPLGQYLSATSSNASPLVNICRILKSTVAISI